MKRALTLCLFFNLVIAGHLRGQDLSAERRQALADSLADQVLEMLQQLRNRDADAVLAAYGRPDEFVHIDNGNVVPWLELEREVRAYLQSVESNELYWEGTPSVVVLDANAAVVYGTHSFHHNEGGTREAHQGEWTGVFQRIDGQWKLVHSHSSDKQTP